MDLPFEMTVEELSNLLSEGREVRLIDCREQDEFEICRIEGAQLLPLSRFAELVPDPASGTWSQDETLVVYCHHGMRSARATQYLRSRGYGSAQSLAGGIDLWSEEIDTTVPRY